MKRGEGVVCGCGLPYPSSPKSCGSVISSLRERRTPKWYDIGALSVVILIQPSDKDQDLQGKV
ncbi:hypothetical protein U3516DRAFT_770651 [Neocallimastix sp. 'constans']